MLSDGVALLLFLFLCQANALPLASKLSEEDEKVTKCITEVLADTLSKPSPIPVTSECMKILREDERVLAMLHHQHLLTELEDLAHQDNAKNRLGHEDRHETWEGESEEREEVKKREERLGKQREAAASEKAQERDRTWKKEGQGLKEFQKTEKIEEKVKEVSHGEDNREALEEEVAKEEMEGEGEEDGSRKKKKRTSSETWSSQEYFGHMKNRASGGPKIREVMVRGSRDIIKRSGSDKRPFELEGEEEDDSSEEKPRSHYHGGHNHEDWEDEEEEGERRRRADLTKRVAEKASDEETAQFEEEEKGVKISNSKGRLHGGWKPWPEEKEEQEEEEGKTRYGHHHRSAGLDLRKRHHREDYPKGKHHSHEEEEGGREAIQKEDQELEKLEEIERDLQKAAEKLQELKRGSPLPLRQGQV